MKKLVILIAASMALMLQSNESKAQVALKQTAYNPTGVIVDTQADTMSYVLSYKPSLVTVSVKVGKNSGTPAGTIAIQYSLDGTYYISAGTSFTLTNITTNQQIWNVATTAKFWRIIVSGNTTVNATCSGVISGN